MNGNRHDTSPEEEENFAASSSTAALNKNFRSAAWHDPADTILKVGLKEVKQRRKLRTTVDEDEISGAQYESKLRNYYTSTNPTPQWALKAQKRVRGQKRRRSSSSSTDEESETEVYPEFSIRSENGLLADSKLGKRPLRSGILNIERLRDVNYSSRSQGSIHSLGFHPNPEVTVLFTAAGDRRLRLFNVWSFMMLVLN
jgi:U3 small nucleolar RNA-associated protein 18